MQNTAIPAYTIMKNAYQQYMAPAVQAAQGLSGLGYTQTMGQASPYQALLQGAGIGLHNMGQVGVGGYAQKMLGIDGLIDPLTFAKQQEISGTMMGLGFNFNNPQYGLGESALQNMVRYNPAINVQLAGQQMDTAMRMSGGDSVNAVANLTASVHKLGEVSRIANISIADAQQRMAQFQQFTGNAPGAPVNYVNLQERYPTIDPTKLGQIVANTPLGQSAALSRGMYSFTVPGMAGAGVGGADRVSGAFDQTLKDAMSTAGVDPSILNDPAKVKALLNPETEEGAVRLGNISHFGFNDQLGGTEIYNLARKAKAREGIRSAQSYMSSIQGRGHYGTDAGGVFAGQTSVKTGAAGKLNGSNVNFYVDPKTGELKAGNDSSIDHVDETITKLSQDQMSPGQALHALHLAGIKGNKAQKIIDKDFIFAGDKGYVTKGGWGDIQQQIKSQAGNANDKPSASGLQKAIDGLDNALNGLKDFKNDYDAKNQ
jgi:hypothetical protein